MLSFMDQFNAARRVSTPTVVIRTADIEATIKSIAYNQFNKNAPMLMWDASRGLTAVNHPWGTKAVEKILSYLNCTPFDLTDPAVMLYRAPQGPDDIGPNNKKFPENLIPDSAILFMPNLQRFMHEAPVIQGIANLRSPFKANGRMCVIPCPGITLSPELAQDVLVIDEPLPDDEQLGGIVDITFKAANNALANAKDENGKPKPRPLIPLPTPEFRKKAVAALCGLPAYPAEQQSSMCISSAGLNLDYLWERKRQHIGQTPGLSVWRGKDDFDSIVGLANAKAYHARRGVGPRPRRGVVFIDEIDKHLAGFGAVGTGDTTTEMVGALLTYMQDIEAEGSLFLGVPGAGKTLLARAIGNQWGVPVINYDLSGMKGSLVGESGGNVRNANKVVTAVTQEFPYFLATCNNIDNLPAELRRRFTNSTFFFDLCTRPEKDAAWEYYQKKFEIKAGGKFPVDTGWTAAEIRNCCYNAYILSCSLEEAATYIVPVSVSAKDKIQNLRRQADGCFISASHPGPYKAPTDLMADPEPGPMVVAFGIIQPGRKINMDDEQATPAPSKKKQTVN